MHKVALFLCEISRSIGSLGVVFKITSYTASRMFIHDHLVLERKRSVLSKKGKKSIILRLEKGEKGTNFSASGVRYLISATTRKRSRSLPTTYRPAED